jgi:crossover junction endodeoxyribonuclease RusA
MASPAILTATLTLPPSVNHAYMTGRRSSKRIMTPRSREWMEYAQAQLSASIERHGWTTLREKAVLELDFFFPDARKRDTHNYLKLLCDAVERAGVVENDCFLLPRVNNYVIEKGVSEVQMRIYAKKST